MKAVVSGNQEVHIQFRYKNPSKFHNEVRGEKRKEIKNGVTIAILTTKPIKTLVDIHDTSNIIAIGRTVCSRKDNFNKPEGRRIALERALELSNLSQEDKDKIIQEVYVNSGVKDFKPRNKSKVKWDPATKTLIKVS